MRFSSETPPTWSIWPWVMRDMLYGETGSRYFFDDTKHLVPGIDNHSLIRLLASQQIAVGLIRTDNEPS